MPTGRRTADPLARGEDSLARGDWAEARAAFEAALAVEETPDGWEGLGWAGWWLHDAELTLRARECAYRAFRAGGDHHGAARVAGWLAADYYEYRGEAAVAQGWLERAHHLLDGQPQGLGHAWLAVHEASFLQLDRPHDAYDLAEVATRIAREHDDPDVEAVGLAIQGATLVARGRVEEGMRRLDAASAIAVAEDIKLPVSRPWTICCTITACDGVGDFPRASQWCDAMHTAGDALGARQMLGVCRSAYGRVLATAGHWAAAETELLAAIDEFAASRPAMAPPGLARLADLRARQGRMEEARELYEQAGPYPPALIGIGQLQLEAGDAASAVDAADRVLRRLHDEAVLRRLPALELLARAHAARGEIPAARDAAGRLQTAAEDIGTPYLRGRALHVCGDVALADGAADEARRLAEDALDCFDATSAPYEGALARVTLAGALSALGRADAAEAHAAAARETFSRLGARRDVERARSNGHAAVGELTEREIEVLRLVGQGLGDAEIAAELVVSPHTVHRHVANIRTKLRLPSRAAAVAHAVRAGLL
jgi:DNA-binding CsgD family transcriptional regulator